MFKQLLRHILPLAVLGALTLSSCVVHDHGHDSDRGHHGRGRGHGGGGYGYGRGRGY